MKTQIVFYIKSEKCIYCDNFKDTMNEFVELNEDKYDITVLDVIDEDIKREAKEEGVKTVPCVMIADNDKSVILHDISSFSLDELEESIDEELTILREI